MFRLLDGFTMSLGKMFPILPCIDYSWVGRGIMRLGIDLSPLKALRGSGESVVIVLDSTGVKAHRDGSWLEKRYVKIHVALNTETGEITDMEMSIGMMGYLRDFEQATFHYRAPVAHQPFQTGLRFSTKSPPKHF